MALHVLRHTDATLLLSTGIHPKVLQERLRHSDISVAMAVYSHVAETMQRDAVDRLAAIRAGAWAPGSAHRLDWETRASVISPDQSAFSSGAPGGTRTPNLLLRTESLFH